MQKPDTPIDPGTDSPSSASAGGTERPLSLVRSLFIGLALIPLNVLWVTLGEQRWYAMNGTALPLFITPVFFLFVLALLNLLWRRLRPRTALRQPELLLVYIMLVISCTFCGQDTFQYLFSQIGHNFWFETPGNRWKGLFFRFQPAWLQVTDPEALRGWYEGHVDILRQPGAADLQYWVVPLIVWGVFFLVLFGMYLCLTVLLRSRWIDDERLVFPIVQLPLAMTDDDAPRSFFRNPRMWAGFACAFTLSLLNGLHEIDPRMPQLTWLKLYDLSPLFLNKPWNAMGVTPTSLYPFAIGIAFFMPLDLCFSCWFFYLVSKLYLVVGSVYGWDYPLPDSRGYPFLSEQTAGAWIGITVISVYSARHALARTLALAFRRKSERSGGDAEAPQYRVAYLGLAGGGAFLVFWCHMLGLSWWVGGVYFLLIFIIAFSITRIRAELGTPHEVQGFRPDQILVAMFGSRLVGPHDLAVISLFFWFNCGYRNHPMPNQMEAWKMMHGKPVRDRGVLGAIALAAIVSLLVTYAVNLRVTYAAGAAVQMQGFKSWIGWEANQHLTQWISAPSSTEPIGIWFIAGSLLFVLLLSFLRTELPWWPLHPAGYALAVSFAMQYFWVPMLIAWAVKGLIVRYGGVTTYRAAIPFFLGLILGDYTIGSLWALLGVVFGIPTYKIFV